MTHIIDLPKIIDLRGNLTFIQYPDQIPFKIERVFWIYDVPGGEKRGGHAYKTQLEVIIALSGSFDVIVKSNNKTTKFTLNRSYYGLYIPSNTWRMLENFSTNSMSLHLSNGFYNEEEYIYDLNKIK